MAEPAPHSDAPEAAGDASPAAESAPREPRRGRPTLLVAAVALLGLFAGYLAWQTAQLQQQNVSLEREVSSLQQQLRLQEATLAGARERAAGLRTQIDDLEAWLAGTAPSETTE